jgi:hypothetical protein
LASFVFGFNPMTGLFSLDGLLWFLATLVLLGLFQRLLHREIQAFFLLLTRRPGITQAIFAVIFFPGVLLHELSHFLAAKIMGVPTGRFSLLPQPQPNGRLRLGYVETSSGGFIRDALIGVAPLVTGCLLIAFAAANRMQLLPLWDTLRSGQADQFWAVLGQVPTRPDFWLWFYLVFTVSSTMLPSASDRNGWIPVALLAAALFGVALLAGAGEWMLLNLAPPFNQFLRALATIFGFSLLIHAMCVVPFWLLHRLLTHLTGIDIGA